MGGGGGGGGGKDTEKRETDGEWKEDRSKQVQNSQKQWTRPEYLALCERSALFILLNWCQVSAICYCLFLT